MEGCIFCKIVKGDAPSMKVFEDEFTLAFMDVAKDVDGHVLVVPKKHIKNILDCDNDTLEYVIKTAKKVSNHLTTKCGYEGVNLLNASDESAGQSVPHFHIHIIPRKSGDGINAWPRFDGAVYETREIYERIRMSIDEA